MDAPMRDPQACRSYRSRADRADGHGDPKMAPTHLRAQSGRTADTKQKSREGRASVLADKMRWLFGFRS
jgi:hypothetical protein